MTETCPVQVPVGGRSVSFYTCGRPVRRDGMCGIHAAAADRRDANAAKRQAERDADEATAATAQGRCDALTAYGITAQPHYSVLDHRYTGKVVVDPEQVLSVIADAMHGGTE